MEHELEEVFAWLEAGEAADYQAGVLVLQKHCKNRSMVAGLLRKKSPTNREKLHYELSKCACGSRLEDLSEVLNHFAQAVKVTVPLTQSVAEVLSYAPSPEVSQGFSVHPEPEHVPEQLRPQADDLTQLMSKVYNQRCQLSNSLATLSEDDGPRVVAEILSLEQQYNALALKRRNLVADEPTAPEQLAPVAEPASPETPLIRAELAPVLTPDIDRAELVKQRNTLRSNISKAKKKAKTSQTEEKRSEYSQKVAKWQVELDQLEMQLKA